MAPEEKLKLMWCRYGKASNPEREERKALFARIRSGMQSEGENISKSAYVLSVIKRFGEALSRIG